MLLAPPLRSPQVGVLCPGAASIALLPADGSGRLCALPPGRSAVVVGQANATHFLAPNETYSVNVSVPRPAGAAALSGLNLTHFSAGGLFGAYPVEMQSPLVRLRSESLLSSCRHERTGALLTAPPPASPRPRLLPRSSARGASPRPPSRTSPTLTKLRPRATLL